MYEHDNTIFNDISKGDSGCTESTCCGDQFGFTPKAGMWDVVSGLETPNIRKMTKYLDNMQNNLKIYL